jgi:tetratricopeptide (TPR) repeat protein
MPTGQDAPQISVADLDRGIIELGHAIALNPRNANAYRERGLLHGRKRDYDHAIADFDKVLSLSPDDARAYYLRALAWHRKGEPRRAIHDFDKAAELDPANAAVYRTNREKAAHDAHVVPPTPSAGAQNSASTPSKGLTGFFKRLAQYYAEFLSTDFKKQRLPRRRLQTADAQGRLVGIPLRKYPGFQQKLWEDLAKPVGPGLSLTVARGSWRAELPKAVVEATAAHIAQVTQQDVDAVIGAVMKNALRVAKSVGDDPHIAFEQFIEEVRSSLARNIISPLLDRMEGFLPGRKTSRLNLCTNLRTSFRRDLRTALRTHPARHFPSFW